MGLSVGLAWVIVVGLATAGCSAMTTPSSTVAQAQQTCVTISPSVTAASLVPDARVQSIVGYANAFCGPLAAGVIPSTVDSNSSAWLGGLVGMLRVLAPVALSLL